jgi:multicomponent Na+:H+ antiporter subunit E
VAVGAVAFGFYLVLGDPTDPFDLATGTASAVVVAAVLGGVVFERTPSASTLGTVARAALFLPVLLAAVVRANLSLARVVLDPRLPVDPSIVRVRAPESGLGRALLANAVTLTPGTVTLDVVEGDLFVHALTPASRAGLEEGGLVRWVEFVVGERARPSGADEGTGDRGTDGGVKDRQTGGGVEDREIDRSREDRP